MQPFGPGKLIAEAENSPASTGFARRPMQIKRDWKSHLWRSVAQGFFGGIALAFVTVACFRLGLGLATTAFAYLVVIVLLSLMGSFYVSAVLSIIAVAALNYFFAPPIFNFRVDQPLLLAQSGPSRRLN